MTATADLDLDECRKLCEQATPGPWKAAPGKGSAMVTAADCAIYINVRTCEVDECVMRWQADARFIAAARHLLPALVAEVERLRAENAALTTRRDELLAAMVRVTNETPFADEAKDALAQRGKLLAEIGTLRAERDALRELRKEKTDG